MRERIPTGTYRAASFGLNWSLLKAWRTSPLLGRYMETTGDAGRDTDPMRFGRASEIAILEPEKFGDRYVVLTDEQIKTIAPPRSTKDGKAAEAAYIGAHPAAVGMTSDEYQRALVGAVYPGRELLDAKTRDEIMIVADAVRRHKTAGPMLKRVAEVQVTRRWQDSKTGEWLKGRLDAALDDGDYFDLKSSRHIVPRRFWSDAWERGYAHQAAMYRRGQKSAGVERAKFSFIVVENKAPFDVLVMPLSGFLLDECDREIDELLALRKRCNEAGEWPGAYPDPVEIEERPRWAQTDDGGGIEGGFKIIEGDSQ